MRGLYQIWTYDKQNYYNETIKPNWFLFGQDFGFSINH